MGYLAIDHTIVVSGALEFVIKPVGRGTLLALAAIILSDSLVSNDFWFEIGLLSGGTTLDQRAAILSNGYGGSASSVFWNGSLPTGDDAHVYALVIAGATQQFRLSALLADTAQGFNPGRISAN